jgi:hypothetical protein
MQTTLEYLTAGIIVLLILGATTTYASNLIYDRVRTLEAEAGLKRVDIILEILLHSPGRPPDWGEQIEKPEAIGLALENTFEPYQLDPKKVRRLKEGEGGYLSPYEIRELLGLDPAYYLSLEIKPIYDIQIEQINSTRFSVTVRNLWGAPVSNANVTAALGDISLEEVNYTTIFQLISHDLRGVYYAHNITDRLGLCTLRFQGNGTSLLLCVGHLGLLSFASWPSEADGIISHIESSMGSISGYEAESSFRLVQIAGLSYVIRLMIWR